MSLAHWQQLAREVKSSTTCPDFLNSIGVHVPRPGASIITPPFIRPGSDSPSFGVYDSLCTDFVTGKKYDVIDLDALHSFNGNKTHALEHLAGRKLPHINNLPLSDVYNSQAAAFSERIDFFHSELLKNPTVSPNGRPIPILDYLQSRGISLDLAKKLKLGFSPKRNRLIIPFFNKHHQPVYLSGRDMSGLAGKTDPAGRCIPKYWYISLQNQDFAEILDKCIFGIDSIRPGFVEPDTYYDAELQQIVKLSTHHIKYDYLAVTEGMFDVISFRAQGWAAVSGKIASHQEKEFLDICRQYTDKGQKIFVCFDNDRPGQDFQKKTELLLFKHGIPFSAGHLPDKLTVSAEKHPQFGQEISIKDVSDYYAAGGSLDELVANARDGMAEIASLCKNEDELEERFKEGARSCEHWELHKLKNAAVSILDPTGRMTAKVTPEGVKEVPEYAHRFDPKNVGFMYAEALRPMQDCDIAKVVEQRHNLVYDTLGQFYEYRKGVWTAQNDIIIQQHIVRAMHGHISAQKTAGVCKYLKIDLADTIQFNTKHNIVFQNGTLWLDEDAVEFYDDPQNPLYKMPKNFKPSRPEDMSTLQLSYRYDPLARNKAIERAAREWTNNPDGSPNEEKYRLLKQIFGYILFVRNTLQKFFVFKGDGANGKSTCMHCIEAILGKQNTTSLQLSRLSSEFDPIMLKNSRVNLCYDAQASIEGAQEVLKALMGGDSITAAKKGVDAESFTTNAKFIVSANKFFSATDVSKGLLRRMLFIAFDNEFKPKAGEDTIEEEIMADLPGLFNFAYEGYKDLKQTGYFCETAEQAELLEQFREQLSPLILFAREEMYKMPGDVVMSEKELYFIYREWCRTNGEKAMGRTKFIPEIRQVIRTDGNVIPDPQRDAGTRQWIFVFSGGQDGDSQRTEGQNHTQPQTAQETPEGVSAQPDGQKVQEVSTQDEQTAQESTKESAAVHSAPVSGEQKPQQAEPAGTQAVGTRTDSAALQEQVAQTAQNPAKTQAETETEELPENRQTYIPGTRYKIREQDKAQPSDPSSVYLEKFYYNEAIGRVAFLHLKNYGRQWQEHLHDKFMMGSWHEGHETEIDLGLECNLWNLGYYLKQNPIARRILFGSEDIFDFED